MTGIYTVTRLSSWPTDHGFKFFIHTKERRAPFDTFSEWVASLAKRSYEVGQQVRIESKQTEWGEQVTNIDLVPSQKPAQAEGVAS